MIIFIKFSMKKKEREDLSLLGLSKSLVIAL